MKKDVALTVMTDQKIRNCVTRNNLFIGTDAAYVVSFESLMEGCDFDFDGFAMTGKFDHFLKWNDLRYASFQEVLANASISSCALAGGWHVARFTGRVSPTDEKKPWQPVDLRLRRWQAVDAGTPLAGINDGFNGRRGPGSVRVWAELPHYGPRPPLHE